VGSAAAPALANTIAFNGQGLGGALERPVGGPGVWVADFRGAPFDVRVEGNSIHDNAGLGIDLGGSYPVPDGVTPNDSAGHNGPNRCQAFRALSAALAGPAPVVVGTLDVQAEGDMAADTVFTLDFYASPSADPSGHGQGRYYLGSARVSTDASGQVVGSP